jgi:hypothetical protein
MDLSNLKKLVSETVEEGSILLAKPMILSEASFARAKRQIEHDGIEFVMISAFRGGKGQPGNRNRHKQMKADFKLAGYPFVEMLGGYSEEEHGEVTEPSLLVLGHERGDQETTHGRDSLFQVAVKAARRHEQDSFIYGGPLLTADGDPAFRSDPTTGDLKPAVSIKAYSPRTGQEINEPWAGPWNNLITAKEDDIYWSVVGGKRGKLAEQLETYKKFRPISRETAMEKDHYLKSIKSGLKRLED